MDTICLHNRFMWMLCTETNVYVMRRRERKIEVVLGKFSGIVINPYSHEIYRTEKLFFLVYFSFSAVSMCKKVFLHTLCLVPILLMRFGVVPASEIRKCILFCSLKPHSNEIVNARMESHSANDQMSYQTSFILFHSLVIYFDIILFTFLTVSLHFCCIPSDRDKLNW